ncbi:glycosyltransferase family 2 protein [Alteromonas sp. H39]|uniref:glycosyltransferase family 2 protein n=1 Tax=Alteromonas sp. H39 TaxID=3389876 RepID=UPI0039E052E9
MPTVSVIIPVFNAGKFIRSTLESVFSQTYTDFEVVIVNDGSTDDSESVIRSFNDNRIVYIAQENGGVSAARNNGIFHAQGKYVAFLDADDLWHPEKLRLQVAALEENPDVHLCYCDREVFGSDSDVTTNTSVDLPEIENTQESLFLQLLKHNHIQCSSVIVRKSLLSRAGIFDSNLAASEDSDLWIRASRHTDFIHITHPLSFYRHHDSNTIHTVEFRRNRLFAEMMFFARWIKDKSARDILAGRIRGSSHSLAYEEQERSNFKNAFRLWLLSFILGKRGVKAFFKILVLWYKSKRN